MFYLAYYSGGKYEKRVKCVNIKAHSDYNYGHRSYFIGAF